MAFYFQKPYAPEIEQLLRQYYQSLSEKDRRRFAAVEAIRLGHGGPRYIAPVLGCDPTHRAPHSGYARVCPAPDGQGVAWGRLATARRPIPPCEPPDPRVSRGGEPDFEYRYQEERGFGNALSGWEGLLPAGNPSV